MFIHSKPSIKLKKNYVNKINYCDTYLLLKKVVFNKVFLVNSVNIYFVSTGPASDGRTRPEWMCSVLKYYRFTINTYIYRYITPRHRTNTHGHHTYLSWVGIEPTTSRLAVRSWSLTTNPTGQSKWILISLGDGITRELLDRSRRFFLHYICYWQEKIHQYL